MAAKHDAKRASANYWVMQQNMARHKSGPGAFVHRKPQPKAVPAKPAPQEQEKTPAV